MGSEPPHEDPRMAPESPLLSLSIEVRLIIYEYAVQERWDIFPEQVTDRSNKFRYSRWKYRDHGGMKCSKPSKGPLTNTQLLFTCRQIYQDLTAYPVFYRVNRFAFERTHTLHRFLAALTSRRRHNIRHILIADDDWWHRTAAWLGRSVYDICKPLPSSIFTLLRDCRDLREITLLVRTYTTPNLERFLRIITANCEVCIPPKARSLWHLPGFNIVLVSDDFTMNLGDDAVVPPERLRRCSSDIIHKFQEARLALLQHQVQLRAFGQQRQALYPSDREVFDASEAAGLDFPGELRITQKRSTGIRDVISSRTRGRLRDEGNISKEGTVVKQEPKYDAEGILIQDYVCIREIQWSGQAIECLVIYKVGRKLSLSWEDLHHFATWEHLDRIRQFYRRIRRGAYYRESHTAQLERLQKTPTPVEIDQALRPFMAGNQPYKFRTRWLKVCESGGRDGIIRKLEDKIRDKRRQDGARKGARKKDQKG